MGANATCTANFAVARRVDFGAPPINGTITSTPAGINCGSGNSACSADFADGTLVTFTATPDPGYIFVGWGGACAGCGSNPTCTVTMGANTTCAAFFAVRGLVGGSIEADDDGRKILVLSPGGGCSMTGSASSMTGLWNILVWLSIPAFVLVRRIRKK